ncbi:hypothetical protein [Hymenobacter sp. B81]|uniref:DUF6712 family protein n=1 Tax=Hymenobacter sp. B81 TaxID=3344878 RepID=UPI0037DC3962
MSYLISKADFPEYTTLSANIGDHLLDPYIRDAWRYDVAPLLNTAEAALLRTARADWSPKLEQLFVTHIKPVWVLEAYRRFLGMHGVHVTPNGLETISDVGHAPISTQQRAELKADAQGKASIERGLLEAALRAYRGTVPSTCSPVRRRPGNGGLRIYTA